MAIGRSAWSQRPYLRSDYIESEVEGELVAQVSDFMCFGITISSDGTIDRDFDVRAFHREAAGRYGTAELPIDPNEDQAVQDKVPTELEA